MPSFCRHNRFIQNCPICREDEAPRATPSPRDRASTPSTASSRATRPRSSTSRGGVRTRQLARATDDGYRNGLVPGVKASADAERLADELAFSAARLAELATDPPGLYAEAVLESDREEALWLALLVAVICPVDEDDPFAAIGAARTPWASGEVPALDGVARGWRAGGDERTLAGYRAWAQRAGTQEAALGGEASWTPQRRFGRAFERLSLPGLDRGARFDFLVTAGRLGLADLRPAALQFGSDGTTLAAKRVFGIGDTLLLDRRATDLADEAGVPLDALDLALFNWGQPTSGRATMGATAVPDAGLRATIGAALDV